MAEKRYLLTPGPTPVPPEVLAELAKPVIHHRERDFREIYERCLLRLQEVYRTKNDVLMFTTSGTGAFESAVANLTSPGDRQLVLSAGNFGERWAGMAKAFGADLVHARLEWGETPEPEDLRSALADAGAVKLVYRPGGGRRGVQSRSRSARVGSLGNRCHRVGLAEGAHVPTRSRLRIRFFSRARSLGERHLSALRHGLGANT